MLDVVAAFAADLARRFPGTSTAVHYVSDIRIFLHWFDGPATHTQRTDVDRFIIWQQTRGRARATINRRLVALRMWFEFLADWSTARVGLGTGLRRAFVFTMVLPPALCGADRGSDPADAAGLP